MIQKKAPFVEKGATLKVYRRSQQRLTTSILLLIVPGRVYVNWVQTVPSLAALHTFHVAQPMVNKSSPSQREKQKENKEKNITRKLSNHQRLTSGTKIYHPASKTQNNFPKSLDMRLIVMKVFLPLLLQYHFQLKEKNNTDSISELAKLDCEINGKFNTKMI